MNNIYLSKCEDGAIWITTDDDQIGEEAYFDGVESIEEQFLIALAQYLGFDPSKDLNLDISEVTEEEYEDSFVGEPDDDYFV